MAGLLLARGGLGEKDNQGIGSFISMMSNSGFVPFHKSDTGV